MIKPDDLRAVIRPVLTDLGYWSQAVENLLLGTAACESNLGTFLFQVEGPALGIFQMEPSTHDDIHRHFLAYRPELRRKVLNWSVTGGTASELVWNLAYAAAMARMQYLRAPEAIPDANDLEGLGRLYKVRYNTPSGAGSIAGFISAYRRMVERRLTTAP